MGSRLERPPRLVRPAAKRPAVEARAFREIEFVVSLGPEIQRGIDVAADVAPDDPAGRWVHADAKRIARAHHEDLGPAGGGIGKHVSLGHGVAALGRRLDAEDFPAEVLGIGGGAAGIARRVFRMYRRHVLRRRIVTGADEQISRRIPGQPAAAVRRSVPALQRDGEEPFLRSIDQPPVAYGEPRHAQFGRSVLGHVKQVHMSRGGEVRRQHEPEAAGIGLGERRHAADDLHRARGGIPAFHAAGALDEINGTIRVEVQRDRVVRRRHEHFAFEARWIKGLVRRRRRRPARDGHRRRDAEGKCRSFHGDSYQISPWASMASATRMKPAMFAPRW